MENKSENKLLLIDFDLDDLEMNIPLIKRQNQLEELFDKHQLIPRLMKEYKNAFNGEIIQFMNEKEIDIQFGFYLLVQTALHRQTTVSTMIGVTRIKFLDDPNPSQRAADELMKAARAGLVNLNQHEHKEDTISVVLPIPAGLQRELDLYQYPLPMLVPPAKIKDNYTSGYRSKSVRRGRVILRNKFAEYGETYEEDDLCLDHLDRINKTKFVMNLDVVRMIQNKWKSIDKQKDHESIADFKRRQKQFEKYDKTAKDVIKILSEVSNQNTFYLTHKYDKRGRFYCQGYHVNYMGNTWNKACVELAKKEIIT